MKLKEKFMQTRQFSLDMVKALQREDFVPQAAVFASPPKQAFHFKGGQDEISPAAFPNLKTKGDFAR